MNRKKEFLVIQTQNGFQIQLNDQPFKTPAGNPCFVPNEKLAVHLTNALSTSQEITLPLQLAYTALDQSLDQITAQCLPLLRHDSLLFCPHEPPQLRYYVEENVKPMLVTFGRIFQVAITPSTNLTPPPLPEALFQKMTDYLTSLNSFAQVAFREIASLLGSTILAYLLISNKITVQQAYEISQIEASFQRQTWGTTDIQLEADQEIMDELQGCVDFFNMSCGE